MLEAEGDKQTSSEVKMRIHDTLLFLEQITGWYEQIRKLDPATLSKLMKLGSKIQTLLGK